MMYVAYAYENHKSWANTTNINDNDTGNRLVGAYKFDGGQVGLAYETLNATRAGISKSRAAWELSGKYKFGASNVGAFYTKAGLLGGVAATGANQISLRYGYNFSKRTEAYALYTAIKNDTNANYGIADVANGYTGVAGSKISGLGFGLVHTF
jgi:predicted porin